MGERGIGGRERGRGEGEREGERKREREGRRDDPLNPFTRGQR